MTNSFDKTCRLRNKQDYDFVFAKAERSFCSLMTVLYRPSATPHSRLGVICGLKVNKRAHERNRLKRLCRESFRQSDVIRSLPMPIDLIVLPKPNASKAENALLLVALSKHWQRISSKVARSGKQKNSADEC